MTAPPPAAVVVRTASFLLVWLAVAGWKPSDLPVGAAVAVAAAFASLVLSPASGGRLRAIEAVRYVLHFLRLSLTSGVSVARRALSGTPDLKPGFVEARLLQEPGVARNAFCVIASLLPGSLLTGAESEDEHATNVHALDVREPVAAELAAEEAAFLRIFARE